MASNRAPTVKPDFDTDVLWKPIRLSNRQRTVSMDSTESIEGGRRVSVSELSNATSPTDMGPSGGRSRKLSFTEMIFGSPKGGFSWGQGAMQTDMKDPGKSVTDDARFKELLKHQSKILNDEGTFKRSDYMKS